MLFSVRARIFFFLQSVGKGGGGGGGGVYFDLYRAMGSSIVIWTLQDLFVKLLRMEGGTPLWGWGVPPVVNTCMWVITL